MRKIKARGALCFNVYIVTKSALACWHSISIFRIEAEQLIIIFSVTGHHSIPIKVMEMCTKVGPECQKPSIYSTFRFSPSQVVLYLLYASIISSSTGPHEAILSSFILVLSYIRYSRVGILRPPSLYYSSFY
jgi:hypothetical protein